MDKSDVKNNIFYSFPSCTWERKWVPSSAWRVKAFPSQAWEREDKRKPQCRTCLDKFVILSGAKNLIFHQSAPIPLLSFTVPAPAPTTFHYAKHI
jgi:hypothetical protein